MKIVFFSDARLHQIVRNRSYLFLTTRQRRIRGRGNKRVSDILSAKRVSVELNVDLARRVAIVSFLVARRRTENVVRSNQ